MNKNTVFMAFAKGKESTDAPVIKRYTGIAPVTIVCVNPNKAQMESTLGINVTDEMNYVGEVDVDGRKVANARISFWLQPVAEKIGMDVTEEELANLCIGTNLHPIILQRRAFYDETGKFNNN